MRLLAFSDLHRDHRRAQHLVEQAAEADMVVGAGDFAMMRIGLAGTIDALRLMPVRTLLVAGNHESDDALRRACAGWKNGSVLHGQGAAVDGVQFFGLGGGIPPTPFPWSFDVTEKSAAAMLADCPRDAVLVVHSPPKGHVDDAHGRSLGSTAILEAIERTEPQLVLCGHIHECWGRESMIGPSRVVNLGPNGMWFEV